MLAALATLLTPASPGQERAFEIRGSVLSGGQPLADIEVSLRAKGTRNERKTVTDLSGSFSFAGVPPGPYDLRAGRESIIVPPSPYLQVSLNVNRDLSLVLPMEGGFCTQMPGVIHYFRRLDPGSNRDFASLSGTANGKRGAPLDDASVTLYVPRLGRIATTRTKRGGSYSFARLNVGESYWIQVLSKGYFAGEITRLKVLAGYQSVYDNLTLEACESGHCDPSVRKMAIGPTCE